MALYGTWISCHFRQPIHILLTATFLMKLMRTFLMNSIVAPASLKRGSCIERYSSASATLDERTSAASRTFIFMFFQSKCFLESFKV